MSAVTKTNIWNAFRIRNGWRKVAVTEARTLLSVSSIRYWEKNGWLSRGVNGDVEYVELTADGINNLEEGIVARIDNHPKEAKMLRFFPRRLAEAVAIVGIVLVLGACGTLGQKTDQKVTPEIVKGTTTVEVVDVTVESARADAVPVAHKFAREIQAEACIARMLQTTHAVDKTTGLSRATQSCSHVWLGHARKQDDWRMVREYEADENMAPVDLNNYEGEILQVDLINAR